MLLPDTDAGWLLELQLRHDRELPELRRLNDEYEGCVKHCFMHPEVAAQLGDRIEPLVLYWAMLVVGALEARLDVEGFRLPGSAADDLDLWRVWQENDCDEESQMAHLDALVMKRAYATVGTNEDDADTPIITFESPLEVYADIDPRTKKVRAALRRWTEYSGNLVRESERYATLYLPDRTVFYGATGGAEYAEIDRDEHGLGEVPVVPMVNRGRLADRCGKSELTPLLPLVRGASKLATDMMVAAEFVALPLRGFLGVGPDAFEDESGNKLSALQAILGQMLAIPGDAKEIRQFEFASAQLGNFHQSINMLAELTAAQGALPPAYLGRTTDNPASADAIRSAETRLIKRAERCQRSFGGGHEKTMRLVRRFQTGQWEPDMKRLETRWRDASTPTVAQSADAAVKLYNLPVPIVPLRQTRQRLGFSETEIAIMEDADALAAAQAAAAFDTKTAVEEAGAAPADGATGEATGEAPGGGDQAAA